MPTIFLHVGPDKTGTSHIQRYLAQNVGMLSQRNFYYYEGPAQSQEAAGNILSGNGYSLYRAMIGEGGNPQRVFDRLTNTQKNVIISSEQLSSLPSDDFGKLKEMARERSFDLKILYYVRAPIDWIFSAIIQQVKRNGMASHPATIIAKNIGKLKHAIIRSDFKTALLDIEKSVGRDSLIVRNYDDDAFICGNLVTDFLTAIGANIEGLSLSTGRTNRSLTQPELALLIAVNRRRSDQKLSTLISNALLYEKEMHPEIYLGANAGIQQKLAENASKEFESDIQFIKQRYSLPHLKTYTKAVLVGEQSHPVDAWAICAAVIDRVTASS